MVIDLMDGMITFMDKMCTSIPIPLLIALFAMALPMINNAISQVDKKYSSSVLVESFRHERIYQRMINSFIVAGVLVLVWLMKIPSPKFLNGCLFIDKSAVILLYISSIQVVLAVSQSLRLINDYNSPKRLLNHLIKKYQCLPKKHIWGIGRFKKIALDKNVKKQKYVFHAISQLLNYSIVTRDEPLARSLFTFYHHAFSKFRSEKENQKIIYPDEFIDSVFEANELLSQSGHLTVSKYNDGGLYDFLLDSSQGTYISNETIKTLWRCIIRNLYFDRPEHIIGLWGKLDQHVHLFLNHKRGHDKSSLAETEWRMIMEFALALGGVVLYSKRYDTLCRLLSWTISIPPKYVLYPNNEQDIIDWCTCILQKRDGMNPLYFESMYPFLGLDGIEANKEIVNWILNYLAVIFVRKYKMSSESIINTDYDTLFDLKLDDKLKAYESINELEKSVHRIFNQSEIMAGLGIDDQKEEMKDAVQEWFDKKKITLQNEIITERNVQEQEITITKSLIDQFGNNVALAYQGAYSRTKDFFDSTGSVTGKESYRMQGHAELQKKINVMEFNTILPTISDLGAREFETNLWYVFLSMHINCYAMKEEDINEIVFDWKDNKELIIFSFDFWLEKDNVDGLLRQARDGITVIQVKPPIYLPSLINSLIIMRKQDLPIIYHKEIPKEKQEKFHLKCYDEINNTYASIIDFNDEKSDELRIMYGTRMNSNELKKMAMFISATNTEIVYSKDAKIIQLKVFSQFEEKGIPTSISDVKKYMKVNLY